MTSHGSDKNLNRPRCLDRNSRDHLLKWVEQSGLERVARIAAWLTEAKGETQPRKLETLLLLKIAHLMCEAPARKLHAVARKVARETHAHRKNIELDSFVSELERDFRQWRHVWQRLARETPMPSSEQVVEYAKRQTSTSERRARARIVQAMPNAIDLYGKLIIEVGRRPNSGVEDKKLVKAAGIVSLEVV